MKRRILVADDELGIRRLLEAILQAAEFEVEFAQDGKEAFQKARDGSFDLIITDQNMPGLTGEQLAAVLSRYKPAMPIILLTGVLFDPGASLSGGMRARLQKPVGPNELLATINGVLMGQ